MNGYTPRLVFNVNQKIGYSHIVKKDYLHLSGTTAINEKGLVVDMKDAYE
jgi:hypothetical protein